MKLGMVFKGATKAKIHKRIEPSRQMTYFGLGFILEIRGARPDQTFYALFRPLSHNVFFFSGRTLFAFKEELLNLRTVLELLHASKKLSKFQSNFGGQTSWSTANLCM